MDGLQHGIHFGELDIRARRGGGKTINGRFPYRRRAVLSDGGRNRRPEKEEFAENAFAFRVNDTEAEIHFLVGHRFDKPLASKLNGTLKLRDTSEALFFEANILETILETQHVRDALALLSAGLAVGISPGFRLPPERAVPREKAESFSDEPINPNAGEHGARIRTIHQALLFELSLVTRPAYEEAAAEEARSWEVGSAAKTPLADYLRRWRY